MQATALACAALRATRLTGKQIMELFESLSEEGKTIIMITHDVNIAKQARRIIRIEDGQVTEVTT